MSWDLTQLDRAHTIVVPGIRRLTMPIGDEVVAALRRAAAGGARIASICTGAFVLAAAGLLDGVLNRCKRMVRRWSASCGKRPVWRMSR